MALAYPEGECFFIRSSLASSKSDGFHPDNAEEFYKTIIVEYVWNVEAYHASATVYKHPRSECKIVRGDWWNTDYGCWSQLPFSYGPSESDIRRRVQHNLCTNGNRFRDYEKGGSAESWFMTMPMPTKDERWLWIDMVGHIRAIYIPIAQSADKDYPKLCTYLQVNFALSRTVSVWCGGDRWDKHTCNKLRGLGIMFDWTVGFDIYGIAGLLATPRQLRKGNVYSLKLIKMSPKDRIKTVACAKSYSDSYDLSWTAVANASFGLDLMWKPTVKSLWLETFLKDTLTFAIGFVPGIGPICAIAFPLVWTAIRDPDMFFEELKSLVPELNLAAQLVKGVQMTVEDALRASIEEMKQYLPDGWEQYAAPMQSAIPSVKADSPSENVAGGGKTVAFMIGEDALAGSSAPAVGNTIQDAGKVVQDIASAI